MPRSMSAVWIRCVVIVSLGVAMLGVAKRTAQWTDYTSGLIE